MAIQNADKNNFKELIGEDFVIADFYGTTCVPCKLFSKILEDIEATMQYHRVSGDCGGVRHYRRPHHPLL